MELKITKEDKTVTTLNMTFLGKSVTMNQHEVIQDYQLKAATGLP